MKEKEVRLTVEEIDYLLKGSIHWNDIEPRVEVSLRKPIEPKRDSPEKARVLERPPEQSVRIDSHQDPAVSEPFLEGNRVYWLLSGVGFLTLGIWAYFVFAG